MELNGVLVWYSRLNAWRQGLREATFTKQDLFKVDIGKYSNIVIFGVDEMVLKIFIMPSPRNRFEFFFHFFVFRCLN